MRYGLVGWKEFHNNRKEILSEFNRAKGYNVSRPVRVQHGKAGDAAVRKWLSDYLPKKYGVTSGFVIPDVIAAEYKLYHFDVLIYDQINSPQLWSDGDYDQSEQGKIRAIPAKHVRAVFEIKASLTSETAREAIAKLSKLNNLVNHLPAGFLVRCQNGKSTRKNDAWTRQCALFRLFIPKRYASQSTCMLYEVKRRAVHRTASSRFRFASEPQLPRRHPGP